MKEYVLVVLKPDVMAKGLTGHVLTRFEEMGLDFEAIKLVQVSKELAEAHYAHLRDKPFFQEIVDYLQGKLHDGEKVIALILGGPDAIARCREMAGATNPEEAHPRSIRGSLGRITTKGAYENNVHVSSDNKEAQREIKLWFSPEEVGKDIFPMKIEKVSSSSKKVWA